MTFLKPILATLIMLTVISFAQTDLENALKVGQVVLNGFSIFKLSGAEKSQIAKPFQVFV